MKIPDDALNILKDQQKNCCYVIEKKTNHQFLFIVDHEITLSVVACC